MIYKGVLTQLSGGDYIGYEKKQRSIMVQDCKKCWQRIAATNDLKALRRRSPDVKPDVLARISVLG